MDTASLQVHCMEFTTGVCSYCVQEQPWGQEIEQILLAEYPEVWPQHRQGIPADHPVWARCRALWDSHAGPVICWEFDATSTSICQQHWQQLGQLFNQT